MVVGKKPNGKSQYNNTMLLFPVVIGVIVFGAIIEAVISYFRTGRPSISRVWYLVLGLALTVLSISGPFDLCREISHPNPGVHTVSLPLTIAFALGVYLLIRFRVGKSSSAKRDPQLISE